MYQNCFVLFLSGVFKEKFVWCPCMLAINVNVQMMHHVFLTGIILLDPMLLPSVNPFKCHEEVLNLQPMIPPKRFDIFPPDWEMLRRSRCVQILL